MNIIVVDDRQLLVNMLLRILKGIDESYNCVGMTNTTEAEEYAKNNPVDVAFLDVEMGPLNGIELAKKLTQYRPRLNIIFVTGHKEYAMDAYGVYPSGYLLKPVSEKDVRTELSKLRYPVEEEEEAAPAKRLRVQCFGEFEVFCDGKPLRFKRSKSKELFAYLVCVRGASINMATIASVLWEDSEENPSEKAIGSMCRNLIADIQNTLHEKELDNVLIKEWKSVSLNTEAFDCDWYDYIHKNKGDLRYPGDFIVGYSWAEYMVPRY
ncbi:MAG: response regulator [Lachnospiraceae bacterium]|nr:response regulator [Lachnospiraceae bacterium]